MKRLFIALLAVIGVVAGSGAANAVCYPWYCPAPPITWTQVASDDFNRSDLGSNWLIRGAGTPWIENNEISGSGTPSIPESYAFWATPTATDQQAAIATVRWEGRDPAHSLAGLSVRADPTKMGTGPDWSTPTGSSGVIFWFVDNLMGLMYEHPKDANGYYFSPLSGTQTYVNTTKFPEGAKVELAVTEGSFGSDTYTAYVNGSRVLQGTLSTSIVPRTQHYVGIELQDDGTAGSQNGAPPANLDDFVAKQGS